MVNSARTTSGNTSIGSIIKKSCSSFDTDTLNNSRIISLNKTRESVAGQTFKNIVCKLARQKQPAGESDRQTDRKTVICQSITLNCSLVVHRKAVSESISQSVSQPA